MLLIQFTKKKRFRGTLKEETDRQNAVTNLSQNAVSSGETVLQTQTLSPLSYRELKLTLQVKLLFECAFESSGEFREKQKGRVPAT